MAHDPVLVPLHRAGTNSRYVARSSLQRQSQHAAADHRGLQPSVPECARPNAGAFQARRPDQAFGPITWLDPAGSNGYNGLSARLEHRFGGGLYFLNSFTWSKALGDSEQALEYYAGYYEANPQNIRNLAQEKGPTSFDVKFINVTSVVYQLPFGKGRRFGAGMNPILDAAAGGWELNSINTANTGTPIDVSYSPSTANDVTGLTNDYRGQAILRPNVAGTSSNPGKSAMINNYFAGYTFTTPPASAPFGSAGRNAFRAPGLEQWDLAADKNFRIREGISLQLRSEFFNIPEPHQLRNPHSGKHQRRVRHHPYDVPLAADSVRAQIAILRL